MAEYALLEQLPCFLAYSPLLFFAGGPQPLLPHQQNVGTPL